MFTIEERSRVLDRLIAKASSDPRIVAAALVGSLARSGDRWSDIDLTFGVADGIRVADVLDDWTREVRREFDAVPLFDLPSRATIYRVFLLRGMLQVDLSFTPESKFSLGSPPFEVLFGSHRTDPPPPPPPAEELFGWAVVYALAARRCIERRRRWQAEHCIRAVRDNALSLACRRLGLPTGYGKGLDELPADVLEAFADALPRSLDEDELQRAMAVAVDGLLQQAHEVRGVAGKVEDDLRELAARG